MPTQVTGGIGTEMFDLHCIGAPAQEGQRSRLRPSLRTPPAGSCTPPVCCTCPSAGPPSKSNEYLSSIVSHDSATARQTAR